MSQIALGFTPAVDFSRGSFMVSSCNEEALRWIEKWPLWPSHCLILYGPESSGKSHLASIWQQNSDARIVTASFINHVDIKGKTILIEDINNSLDENGLFHLYNEIRQQGGHILITSNVHPAKLNISLPDLRSRLNSCPSIAINQPDDELLTPVLGKLFSDRQLRVGEDIMRYILLRMERSFRAAEQLVQKIDELSLQEKRNVTIPLVKKVFEQA